MPELGDGIFNVQFREGRDELAVSSGEERRALAVYIENLMGVPEKDSAHGAFLLSGE